jgi:hypothetical protein
MSRQTPPGKVRHELAARGVTQLCLLDDFLSEATLGQVSQGPWIDEQAIAVQLGCGTQYRCSRWVMLICCATLFGVAYAGFGILVALTTRNVQATNTSFLLFFPLLFLTPNFVPFDRLSPVMETLARINPVSYVIVGLRSLILDGWVVDKILVCLGVTLAMGVVLIGLSLRAIETYDR